MKNKTQTIKSIIQLKRHGARTSSSIGRKEDILLSPFRKGLTCVGYFQFFQYGREYASEPFFKKILNHSNLNINLITSDKSRVLTSAYGFIDGILSSGNLVDLDSEFLDTKENDFSENTFKMPKFNKKDKYNFLLNKFDKFHEKAVKLENSVIHHEKINFNINKKIFDKTITIDDEPIEMKIKQGAKLFEKEVSFQYLQFFTPYFKKLFREDLGRGVFDFKLNKEIDKEYFTNNSPVLSVSQVKRLIDFIRCNKFYEDIPIYKTEYIEFVEMVKKFLLNYYNQTTTSHDDICVHRLKHFLVDGMFKIVENDPLGEHSYSIYINHNTAIRSFIKFMLDGSKYTQICNKDKISEEEFNLICPKFAGEYSIVIYEDKSIEIYANRKNISNLCKKEFVDLNENRINFDKFKGYLKEYHKLS